MPIKPRVNPERKDAASTETQPKTPGLQQHDFVERVLGAPTEFPVKGSRLYGFLGKDSEAGFWRVYLSLDLDHYIRVAEADIITVSGASDMPASQKMDEVWIKATADLTETRAIPKQMQASFLSGPLIDRLGVAAISDPVYNRMSARRSAFRRGMTRRSAAVPMTWNCSDLAPQTIEGEGCGGPEMTSYETGCGVNPSADCGTYLFGCPPTGPQCIDTYGPSCRSEDPRCNSRPSICLCDSRHRSECC